MSFVFYSVEVTLDLDWLDMLGQDSPEDLCPPDLSRLDTTKVTL